MTDCSEIIIKEYVYEAIEACLSVEIEDIKLRPEDKVLEIAV